MACSSVGANDRRINQFNKIRGLDKIASDIAALAAEYGIENLKEKADEACGSLPEGSFMEAVDLEHPHQSLSSMTEIVENRAAFITMNYIRQIPVGFDEVRDLIGQIGASMAIEDAESIDDVYTYIDQHVLDGMPCDHTKEIFKHTDTEIIWQMVIDTHSEIWKKAGGDGAVYDILLGYFITGLISKAGYIYDEPAEGLYSLKKA